MKFSTAFVTSVASLVAASAAPRAKSASNGLFAKMLRRRLDDNDNDSVGDNDNDGNELDDEIYEMDISYSTDKVEIESESLNSELEYLVEADTPLLVRMKYEDKITNGTVETTSRALLHYVQEWRDTNGDGIMQVGEEVTAGLHKIGAPGYQPITPPIEGNTYYNFDVKEIGNLVGITAHVTSIATLQYDPSSIKFDFYVNNWQYSDPANQLAVLIEVRMKSETEYENDGDDADISEVTSSSAYSSFDWRTTFVYDTATAQNLVGTIQSRAATKEEIAALQIDTQDDFDGETPTYMWYCFGNGAAQGATRIFWDPSLDANNGGSSGGSDTLSNGAIAGAVVGSIAGVAIVGAVGFYAVNNFIAKKRSDALIQKDPSGL